MKLRCTAALVAAWAAIAASADGMPWSKDWDTAKADAAKAGKLIMVDFYTNW